MSLRPNNNDQNKGNDYVLIDKFFWNDWIWKYDRKIEIEIEHGSNTKAFEKNFIGNLVSYKFEQKYNKLEHLMFSLWDFRIPNISRL